MWRYTRLAPIRTSIGILQLKILQHFQMPSPESDWQLKHDYSKNDQYELVN